MADVAVHVEGVLAGPAVRLNPGVIVSNVPRLQRRRHCMCGGSDGACDQGIVRPGNRVTQNNRKKPPKKRLGMVLRPSHQAKESCVRVNDTGAGAGLLTARQPPKPRKPKAQFKNPQGPPNPPKQQPPIKFMADSP